MLDEYKDRVKQYSEGAISHGHQSDVLRGPERLTCWSSHVCDFRLLYRAAESPGLRLHGRSSDAKVERSVVRIHLRDGRWPVLVGLGAGHTLGRRRGHRKAAGDCTEPARCPCSPSVPRQLAAYFKRWRWSGAKYTSQCSTGSYACWLIVAEERPVASWGLCR